MDITNNGIQSEELDNFLNTISDSTFEYNEEYGALTKKETEISASLLDNINNTNTNINTAITSGDTTLGGNYNINTNSNIGGYGGFNQPYTTNTGTFTTQGWDYSSDFKLESDDLAINIEKLFTLSEEKRDVLKEIIKSFINESDHNIKKMLLNTLESYNLIIDKKTLERKIKISNIVDEDNEEEK